MIDKVCKYLDITKEQILASRVTDESVIVVVDYGVSGGKKYTIAIADLEADPTPEAIEVYVTNIGEIVRKSVAEIKSLELSGEEWLAVLTIEKTADKPRSSLIDYIESKLEASDE